MVFQQLALFPHMTVFDNIGFGLKMKGVARNDIRRRVREMLQLVRLEGFDERRINQLSGGQQQRVAIARALINRPQVLLLDEPLGALDLQLRVEMQEELKRVQHEVGTTFIYVTHDQGEALTMSDRIGVMHEGRMIQIGNPTEIYEEPRTAFVAKFIGNTNLVRGDVQEQENDETMVRAGPLQIQGRTTDQSATGEVLISIRPEKIFLGEQAIGMANEFQGRITSAVFKGTAYEYRVSLDGDISLDVVVPNVEKGEQFPLDSSVIVGWSTTATHILPT